MSEDNLSWDDYLPRGGQKPRDAIIPRFSLKAMPNEARSRNEGRPCFDEIEFVEMVIPGNRGSAAYEEVTDEHRARWPKAYAAFKAGLEIPEDGVPLENWPPMASAPGRLQELKALNIRTVEALAAVTDGNLPNLGHGARELRERAKAWLEAATKGGAFLERLLARAEKAEHAEIVARGQLRELGNTVEELRARLAKYEAAEHA